LLNWSRGWEGAGEKKYLGIIKKNDKNETRNTEK
jgi:hypothetical protein